MELHETKTGFSGQKNLHRKTNAPGSSPALKQIPSTVSLNIFGSPTARLSLLPLAKTVATFLTSKGIKVKIEESGKKIDASNFINICLGLHHLDAKRLKALPNNLIVINTAPVSNRYWAKENTAYFRLLEQSYVLDYARYNQRFYNAQQKILLRLCGENIVQDFDNNRSGIVFVGKPDDAQRMTLAKLVGAGLSIDVISDDYNSGDVLAKLSSYKYLINLCDRTKTIFYLPILNLAISSGLLVISEHTPISFGTDHDFLEGAIISGELNELIHIIEELEASSSSFDKSLAIQSSAFKNWLSHCKNDLNYFWEFISNNHIVGESAVEIMLLKELEFQQHQMPVLKGLNSSFFSQEPLVEPKSRLIEHISRLSELKSCQTKFTGAFHSNFFHQTGINQNDFNEFLSIAETGNYDVLTFNPNLLNASLFANIFEQLHFCGQTEITKYAIRLGIIKDADEMLIPRSFVSTNFVLATENFWQAYLAFVLRFLNRVDDLCAKDQRMHRFWHEGSVETVPEQLPMKQILVDGALQFFLSSHAGKFEICPYPFSRPQINHRYSELADLIFKLEGLKSNSYPDVNGCSNSRNEWDQSRALILKQKALHPIIFQEAHSTLHGGQNG